MGVTGSGSLERDGSSPATLSRFSSATAPTAATAPPISSSLPLERRETGATRSFASARAASAMARLRTDLACFRRRKGEGAIRVCSSGSVQVLGQKALLT